MKRFDLNTAVVIIIALLSFSCSDFLEENPKDRLSEQNFYETKEDAKGALNAIYSAIDQNDAFNRSYFQQVEIKADYLHGRGSTHPIESYQGLDQINVNRVELIWNSLYQGILYANIAIERINEMEAINDSEKVALIAEAKFMRAFAYYHLAINWGGVPIVLNSEDEEKPRSPKEEVYKVIVNDLSDAETNLPSSPSEFGRPTSWSAKAFLSLIYLTTEKWKESEEKAKEVIDSGVFSLVTLGNSEDFIKVFGPEVNGSSEEIFYLKHNHDRGWEWPLNLLWESSEYAPFGNFVVFTRPDNKFISSWDDDDFRKQFNIFTEYTNPATGQVEKLPSSTPVLISKFRDPGSPGRDKFANDFPFLRYADILLIHAEASNMANGGPNSSAVESLNVIKRRAYGYDPMNQSPVDYSLSGWSVDSFRKAVIKERGYELFVEGKRWQDLRRTGMAKSVIREVKNIEIKEASLLWPIPRQEIETNPNIDQADQNPGY